MRNLNKGQQLYNSELYEIVNNLYVSCHAKERIYERGTTIKELKQVIRNPYLAYFNTDGTINIAKDEYHYMVLAYDELHCNYIMITYKEQSRNGFTIYSKMKIAQKGIDR